LQKSLMQLPARDVDTAAIMVMGGVVSLPVTEARRALEAATRHILLFGRPDGSGGAKFL
jgi:hypothetical protein